MMGWGGWGGEGRGARVVHGPSMRLSYLVTDMYVCMCTWMGLYLYSD